MAKLTLTLAGRRAVLAVHQALSQYAPEWVAHFDVALTEVRFGPEWCPPGAVACVRKEMPRVAFFALAPEQMEMAELGRVLLHEARHWQKDLWGNWYVQGHRCSDPFCTLPDEKYADAVYQGDESALPQIVRALYLAGHNPYEPYPRPSAGLSFGDFLFGAGAVALAATLLSDD